jgi:hypothetical protein
MQDDRPYGAEPYLLDPLSRLVQAEFRLLEAIQAKQTAEYELRRWLREAVDDLAQHAKAHGLDLDRKQLEEIARRWLVDPERAAKEPAEWGLREIVGAAEKLEPDLAEEAGD